MTFAGTFVITLISVLAALFLIFGAKAYVAGGMFVVLAIGALVAMYKLATEVDKHLP